MKAARTTDLRGAVAGVAVAGLAVAGLVVGGLAVSGDDDAVLLTTGAAGTAAEPTTSGPSASPTSSPAPPPDPCALLTDTEAAVGLGSPVTAVPTGTQCTYVADDGSGRSIALLVPTLVLPEGASLEAGAQQAATALGGEARPLTDVGDEGYALIAPTLAQAIGRSGDDLLSAVLTAPSGTADEQADLLGDVLRTAFSRY